MTERFVNKQLPDTKMHDRIIHFIKIFFPSLARMTNKSGSIDFFSRIYISFDQKIFILEFKDTPF